MGHLDERCDRRHNRQVEVTPAHVLLFYLAVVVVAILRGEKRGARKKSCCGKKDHRALAYWLLPRRTKKESVSLVAEREH